VLVSATAFWEVILAVHIIAVVVAFGVTFAYPVLETVGARMDPRGMPWLHRMQQTLSKRLINPGAVVVLAAGIYLASDLHQWSHFYVQWGIGAIIVLGALDGAYMLPRTRKLTALAERDLAASPGEPSLSEEYFALRRRIDAVGAVMGVLVLVTIYLMSVQA